MDAAKLDALADDDFVGCSWNRLAGMVGVWLLVCGFIGMERTIEHARDLVTGEEIEASKFFQQEEEILFSQRRRCADDNRENCKGLVCSYCNQPVYIVGDKSQEMFFKHYQERADCPIKTKGNFSQEDIDRMRYAGVKESVLHQTLKQEVGNALLSDSGRFKDVKMEKIRYSTKDPTLWRRPDVSGTFLGQKMVFEIQLSTTYLNVIAEREAHYRDDKSFILWLFASFDPNGLKFVHKDILYANHGNAFVFDEEAMKRSNADGRLILHCYQLLKRGGSALGEWVDTFVELADLTFDAMDFRVYLTPPELRVLAAEFGVFWLERKSLSAVDRMAKNDEFHVRFASAGLNYDYELGTLLNALYSLKTGTMVEYNFPSDANGFLQLANVFLASYQKYTLLFFWAMKHFGWSDKVRACKKGDKLKEKFDAIRLSLKLPEFRFPEEYVPLVRLLFPELPPKAFGPTTT